MINLEFTNFGRIQKTNVQPNVYWTLQLIRQRFDKEVFQLDFNEFKWYIYFINLGQNKTIKDVLIDFSFGGGSATNPNKYIRQCVTLNFTISVNFQGGLNPQNYLFSTLAVLAPIFLYKLVVYISLCAHKNCIKYLCVKCTLIFIQYSFLKFVVDTSDFGLNTSCRDILEYMAMWAALYGSQLPQIRTRYDCEF